MAEYPEVFLEFETMPMSAGMASIDLPDIVTEEYLDGSRRVQANPVLFKISSSEKDTVGREIIRRAGKQSNDPKFSAKLKKQFDSGKLLTIPVDNSKLGSMQNFSLPVGQTERGGACIGATEMCEKVCYLTGGFVIDPKTGAEIPKGLFYRMNQVPYYFNWAVVELFPDRWIERMVEEITDPVFRLHVGGDFYTPEYVDYWIDIAKALPETRFFAYTRTWQNGRGSIRREMLPALSRFAAEPNCRLLLSVDAETGIPDKNLVPGSIRAWMAIEDSVPSKPVELIFRDKGHLKSKIQSALKYARLIHESKSKATAADAEKKLAQLRMELSPYVKGNFTVSGKVIPVCPIEINPLYIKKSGEMSCSTCGWCFSALHAAQNARPEDKPEEMSEYLEKDVVQTIRGLSKFKLAANPGAACATCVGDCACERCSHEKCEDHMVCACCCGCEASDNIQFRGDLPGTIADEDGDGDEDDEENPGDEEE
jgi:hypothetical protein